MFSMRNVVCSKMLSPLRGCYFLSVLCPRENLCDKHCLSSFTRNRLVCRNVVFRNVVCRNVVCQNVVCRNVYPPVKVNVRQAGHAHWKNVKGTKEAKEKIKSQQSIKIVNKLRQAVREGDGMIDPRYNSKLERVIELAQQWSVPMTVIKKNLSEIKDQDSSGSQHFIEAKGIGPCFFVIEVHTDKLLATRQKIQSILKKFGGTVGEAGFASHSFEFKGEVTVRKCDAPELTHDQVEELAIESGAEDFEEAVEADGLEDGQELWKFTCHAQEVKIVKDYLHSKGLVVASGRQVYKPLSVNRMPSEQAQFMIDMIDQVEDLDPVTCVFDNIEVQS